MKGWTASIGLCWAGPFLLPLAAQENNPQPTSKLEEGRYRSALLFANVIELIRDGYLEPEKTDYDKMTYSALRGLLSSLDPHSQFLDPENYTMIRTETEGQFGGLVFPWGWWITNSPSMCRSKGGRPSGQV